MKKSLLFGLGGFMIVSSVFALPAPEDRKALCEKYPDKYVWVEKTEACIPINPCSNVSYVYNSAMEAYCIDVGIDGSETDEQLEFICKTSLEKRQGSKAIKKGEFFSDDVRTYFMSDGMYMACRFSPSTECKELVKNMIDDAYNKVCHEFGGIFDKEEYGVRMCRGILHKTICEDIADKISLYSGCYTFAHRFRSNPGDFYNEGTCYFETDWLTCPDE